VIGILRCASQSIQRMIGNGRQLAQFFTGLDALVGVRVLELDYQSLDLDHLFVFVDYFSLLEVLGCGVPLFLYSGKQLRTAPAVLAVVITALLGLLDESIQALLPNRVFDMIDVGFNALLALWPSSPAWLWPGRSAGAGGLLTWGMKSTTPMMTMNQPENSIPLMLANSSLYDPLIGKFGESSAIPMVKKWVSRISTPDTSRVMGLKFD
jgi:hypothetical protein